MNMNMNKQEQVKFSEKELLSLPTTRVMVRLISHNYPYYGFIVGRDNNFLCLNLSEDKSVNDLIWININNIMLIKKEVSR